MGYGGLIPFAVLAVALWTVPPEQRAWVAFALLGYAAVIASFLGALHWGLVLRDASRQSLVLLGWGVLPSLVAWLALLAGPGTGLPLIAALLWTCFAVDRVVYPRHQVQGWLPMRLVLTCIASVSCVAGALAVL